MSKQWTYFRGRRERRGLELAAEADLAVSEPESIVAPQAAEDRAAPERGPRSATAAQGEAGQEPSSQGTISLENPQQS